MAANLLALNTTQPAPTSFPFNFTIQSRTDLYQKPPASYLASQPTFYVPITLKSLASATVSIGKIPYAHVYDQAGIVLLWANRPHVWIKAGVEFFEEELRMSSVATGLCGWSDWSVGAPVGASRGIVVSVERAKDQGPALIVKVNGSTVRKLSGVFVPENEEETVYVGIYGARTADVDESLEVEISSFELKQEL
ncbi:hypothetical protein FA15DRAFT_670113 [Coprinopsis marcescibilis]|uniref:Uncharacterized protein n=1 Tax=Coprinopsis marcescibilis TaxID=230819 RepID=A0A5C3KUD3_COPMA|nr:hypothetical protein FA15DRAFT_670113 [Coprinopsis marcescibilis]